MKYTKLANSLFILIGNTPYTVNKNDFKYDLVMELINNNEQDQDEYLKILNIKQYFALFYPQISIDAEKILYKGNVYFTGELTNLLMRDFLYNKLDLNSLFTSLEASNFLGSYQFRSYIEKILLHNRNRIPFNFVDCEGCQLITVDAEVAKSIEKHNADSVNALKVVYIPNLKNFQLQKFLSLKDYFVNLTDDNHVHIFDKIINMCLNKNLLYSSLIFYGKFFKDCFELDNPFNTLALNTLFDTEAFKQSFLFQKKYVKKLGPKNEDLSYLVDTSLKSTAIEFNEWTGADPFIKFDMEGYTKFFKNLKSMGYSVHEIMFIWSNNYNFSCIEAIQYQINKNIKDNNPEKNDELIRRLMIVPIHLVDKMPE